MAASRRVTEFCVFDNGSNGSCPFGYRDQPCGNFRAVKPIPCAGRNLEALNKDHFVAVSLAITSGVLGFPE
jgi:hypothetical protein